MLKSSLKRAINCFTALMMSNDLDEDFHFKICKSLKQQAKKLAQQLADAQALAEKLAATVINVAVKANEDGKIFGTVTTAQIAEALSAQGFEIDRKVITIEPVKELGEAVATARLHREVKAEIKLNVVAE